MNEGSLDYGYRDLEREVRGAIENTLRPELVGRLQRGIVVFDALSPATVAGIASKSLGRVVLSAKRQARIDVELDEPALIALIERELTRRGGEGGMAKALVTGGRAVEAVVGDIVGAALQEWIVEHDPEPDVRVQVTSDEEAVQITCD
jgi:ATP-dependent Clp protease ATP-binding subunit ClpA